MAYLYTYLIISIVCTIGITENVNVKDIVASAVLGFLWPAFLIHSIGVKLSKIIFG